MAQDIIDIISETVQNIDNTVQVVQVLDETPTTVRVILCDVKWLKIGGSMFVNNELFTVVELDRATGNVLFTRGAATLNRRDVGTIKAPIFIHGTRTTANTEWLKSIAYDVRLGVPLIWLHESIPATEYDDTSSKAYDAQVRLFFLDELTDPTNGVHNEALQPSPVFHLREQAAKPMQALADAFNDAIDARYDVERGASNYRQALTLFGNENQSGTYEMILGAKLGGVETRPTLTVSKRVGCCNKTLINT